MISPRALLDALDFAVVQLLQDARHARPPPLIPAQRLEKVEMAPDCESPPLQQGPLEYAQLPRPLIRALPIAP
jgi:hypothetical protein